MKKLKLLTRRIIICIVIFMLIFSSVASTSFAYTPEEVGNAVAGFAKHVVDTYGPNGKNIVGYRQIAGDKFDNRAQREASGKSYIGEPGHSRTDNPIWNPSQYNWDSPYIYFDCTSFATGCYHYVAGLINEPYATASLYGTPADMQGTFEKIHWDKQDSSLKVGDLLYYHESGNIGHGWIYIGGGQTAEDGSVSRDNSLFANKDVYIYRITAEGAKKVTNLNTEFSATGTSSSGAGGSGNLKKIDYSNFFFNGIPDGKYSLASRKSFFEFVIDAIKDLLNMLIGLITYLLRGVIIGFISIFDRLINNTIQSLSGTQKSLEESGVSATNADDPESINRSVTIEGLVYGDVDLFDINIFRVD